MENGYFELFKNALDEKGLKIKDLNDENVIKKFVFYSFHDCCLSLENGIKIANYIEMSLDYILEFSDKNNFKRYKFPQKQFYKNLTTYMDDAKITRYKMGKDIKVSYTSFARWEKGIQPKLSKVIEIARYLGCNIDDLLETEK